MLEFLKCASSSKHYNSCAMLDFVFKKNFEPKCHESFLLTVLVPVEI
jgi:hypothetical protein